MNIIKNYQDFINESKIDNKYGNNMKNMSLKLANLYKKYLKSDKDEDYDNFINYSKKIGIPDKQLEEIKNTIIKNNDFRPIDIYKFW